MHLVSLCCCIFRICQGVQCTYNHLSANNKVQFDMSYVCITNTPEVDMPMIFNYTRGRGIKKQNSFMKQNGKAVRENLTFTRKYKMELKMHTKGDSQNTHTKWGKCR